MAPCVRPVLARHTPSTAVGMGFQLERPLLPARNSVCWRQLSTAGWPVLLLPGVPPLVPTRELKAAQHQVGWPAAAWHPLTGHCRTAGSVCQQSVAAAERRPCVCLFSRRRPFISGLQLYNRLLHCLYWEQQSD